MENWEWGEVTTTDGAGDEVTLFDTFAAGGGGGGIVGRGVRSNSVLSGLADEGVGSVPLTLFRRNQSMTIFARPVEADESDPATEVDVGNPPPVEAAGFHAVPETKGVANGLGTFELGFEFAPIFVGGAPFGPDPEPDATTFFSPPDSRSKMGVDGATSLGIFEAVFLLKGCRLIAFCLRLFLLSSVTSSSAFAASIAVFDPTFPPNPIDPFSFSFVGVKSSLALDEGKERVEVDVGRGGGDVVDPLRMFRNENRSVDNPFLCLAATATESRFADAEAAEEGVGEMGRAGVDGMSSGTGFVAYVCRSVTTAWGVIGSSGVALSGGVVGAAIVGGMGGV